MVCDRVGKQIVFLSSLGPYFIIQASKADFGFLAQDKVISTNTTVVHNVSGACLL